MASDPILWTRAQVRAPGQAAVDAVMASGLPTVENGNRLQSLNIYLPSTAQTDRLVGEAVSSLPAVRDDEGPRVQVHVHGGAWRDPMTDANSIEAAVARAFAGYGAASPIDAIASLNYTLTQFPLHPVAPYDAIKDEPKDPAREAVHPQHVHDVYSGLITLGRLGLTDGGFVLTGHSAGSCLVMQSVLRSPADWGLRIEDHVPTPAAAIGLNGLYDLPALVHGLDPEHALTGDDYRIMLFNAFGPDERRWADASPARFDPSAMAARADAGLVPRLVLIDQSPDDQLVPMNQRDHLAAVLSRTQGVELVIGRRAHGKHSEPWLGGSIIWDSVRDVLERLRPA